MSKSRSTKFVTTFAEWQWDSESQEYRLVKREGYDYDGPWALAHTNPTWRSTNFLFRNDDGTLSTATNIASGGENAAVVASDGILPGAKFRVRMDFGDTANADSNNVETVKLQFRVDTGGGFGAWGDVAATGSVHYAASGQSITDGDNDTTQRLSGVTGSATYQSGWNEYADDGATNTSRTYTDDFAEFEFCLETDSGTDNYVFEFRIVTGTDDIPTIDNTASITLDSGNVTIDTFPDPAGNPAAEFAGLLPVRAIDDPTPVPLGGFDVGFTGLAPTLLTEIGVPLGSFEVGFTGLTPTQNQNHPISVPKTELHLVTFVGLYLNGQAVTISIDAVGSDITINTFPDPAGNPAASFTGLAPTILTEVGVPVGQLQFGDQAPTAEITHIRQTGIGSLTLTGQEPTATGDIIIGVPVGSLTISGQTPNIDITYPVPLADPGLVIVPLTPERVINVIRGPPVGELQIAALIPSAEIDHFRQVPIGGLSFTGLVPDVVGAGGVVVPDGSLSLSGLQPSAEITHNRGVPAGTLSLAGKTPALEIIINNADSSLVFTGKAPIVSFDETPPGVIRSPDTVTVTLSGQQPQRAVGLLLRGYEPTVVGGSTQPETSTGAIELQSYAPFVVSNNQVQVPVGSLSFVTYAADIPFLHTPFDGSLTLTGLQLAPLAYSWTVRPGAGSLTLTGLAPSVSVASAVTPSKKGGRKKKGKRYVVEVDGEFIQVDSIRQAEAVLSQVRDVAEEAAERSDEPAKVIPRVSVKLVSGRATQSKTLNLEVKRTQAVINRIYRNAQARIDRDQEIARLIRLKIREEEDEEEALIALLL